MRGCAFLIFYFIEFLDSFHSLEYRYLFSSMHDVGFLIDRVDVFGMFQAQVIMSALVHYL